MSTDDARADEATTEDEATPDTVSPDKSSKPAVAVTTAPHVRVDRGDHSVGGSASSAGTTEEHEVDPERHGADDAGPVDVDAVLTDDDPGAGDDSSTDAPPEPPA